ncbi:hypothetical protein BJ912DRAFT_44745 [Pholiota molesta]|nr:hypothetical protein BJ912DRAFT_44745 [Pholiota molesta]
MASPPQGPPNPAPRGRQYSPIGKSNVLPQVSGDRKVVQASLPETQDMPVAEFWNALDYNSDDFKQTRISSKYKDYKKDFCTYMYDISKKMHEEVNAGDMIYFVDVESRSLLQHPTGSDCRPDSVAVRSMLDSIHWSDVEAAIEIQSEGTNATDGPRQAMSYAYFLLQARPDRVAVQGMYVDSVGVTLFIVSCTEIKRTPRLPLKKAASVQLLYAFVKRLYDPLPFMVDPTIRKQGRDDKGRTLFNIDLKIPGPSPATITCKNYYIFDLAPSGGQRTHVFVNLKEPTIVEDKPVHVIKDQYRRGDRRFSEKDVIDHIHSGGDVPGIVRIVYAEQVYRGDGSVVSSGRREKTRICMADFGKHMMDVETPKEALMTIYDLLEATRFIYINRQVLHRDISEGNVLVKVSLENMPEPIENVKKEITLVESSSEASVQTEGVKAQPCFIAHLLDMDKSVDRRKTSLLLVDFDRGDITNVNEKPHTDRTGTTIFMAKAIRNGGPHGVPGFPAIYESVPQITAQVRAAYTAAHPDRLIRFSDSIPLEFSRVGTADQNKFRHQLYHDAESAYWLLLRWAILAYPVDDDTPTEIFSELWGALTGIKTDIRPYSIQPDSLNPGYRELHQLLADVGGVFASDMHWATKEPYKHFDFAHEVFQRHILNFIIKNEKEPFMNLLKADNPRKCPKNVTSSQTSIPNIQLQRIRSDTITSSQSSSQSNSPAPFSDDDSMPPPSSSRPHTRSTTADSSGLRTSLVPRSSSSLRTASSSASSVPTQSSSGSKRTRASERSEPESVRGFFAV